MTNPTSNFGWQMPTPTDLVTDLPADFEVFGQAVDTSLADLKGGTTGQVLAKASNTDMDFVWSADASGIPASAFTAKGNILVGTGASTYTAQAVGTNGQVLTANSAQADGVEWTTIGSPPTGWTLLNTGGTAMTGASTITVSGITSKQILVFLLDVTNTATAPQIFIRPNNLTTAIYDTFGIRNTIQASYSQTNNNTVMQVAASNGINLAQAGGPGNQVGGYVFIDLANTTGTKRWTSAGSGQGSSADFRQITASGTVAMTAAITSIAVFCNSGTFNGGTLYVWGSN